MNAAILAILLVCVFHRAPAYGGEVIPDREDPSAVSAPAEGDAATPEQTQEEPPALSDEEVRRRTRLLMGGVAAVGLYGVATWWKDGFGGRFRTTNEGWFGQNTYAGGADKLGHAYAAYVGTRLLSRGFEWAGNDSARSLRLALATSLSALLAVEVLDGYSKKYRFSKEDVVMNVAGAGLAALLEKHPDLDRLLDFRLQYWPSGDSRRLNQHDPVADHSGQTYLLIAKASGVAALRRYQGLRYFELAAGYGSRGYEPNSGAPATDRARHVYFGVSLNLSEILAASVFRGAHPSRAQKVTNTVLEFIQVPGTAALADHRL